MSQDRSRRRATPKPGVEAMEVRMVLSTMTATAGAGVAAEVAGHAGRAVATRMTLDVAAGTLGQPMTFVAQVTSASARAGAPTGTVNFYQDGQLVSSATLAPNPVPLVMGKGQAPPVSRTSAAMTTLTPQVGGESAFFGKHVIKAVFVPDGAFTRSVATKPVVVAQPTYADVGNGVKVATIAPGTGAAIQAGQTANVLYSGYLASNGKLFDDSANDGGSTLGFPVGAGRVIPGFDAGALGMQVGETRIIRIPPAAGYGSTPNGPIPANSTLVFVVTLKAIT